MTVRVLVVQVFWSAVYIAISFVRRGAAGRIGLALNPVLLGAALVGLHGTLRLSWPLLAISLLTSFVLFVTWIMFVMLNYIGAVRAGDDFAWVVLALFLPGLVVDLLIILACLPLLRALLQAEAAEAAGEAPAGGSAGFHGAGDVGGPPPPPSSEGVAVGVPIAVGRVM